MPELPKEPAASQSFAAPPPPPHAPPSQTFPQHPAQNNWWQQNSYPSHPSNSFHQYPPQQQQAAQQQYQQFPANNFQQQYQQFPAQNNAAAWGAPRPAPPAQNTGATQPYSILNPQQPKQFASNVTTAAPNSRYQMNQQWQNMTKQKAQGKQSVAAQIKAAKFAMQMKNTQNNRAAAPNALQKKGSSPASKAKKKDEAFPKSLVIFVQKCFGVLKSVTNNPERDRSEVHEELKAIIAQAKSSGTLHKTNWEKHEYPPKLKRLVDASRKRKREHSQSSNKRRKRGVSPASFGNSFYAKQKGGDSSDSEGVGWKNNQRGKKGKQGKRKNHKKKNNFNNKVANQADSWFAEAESDNINAARAKRAKRFGATMLKKKVVDWRKTTARVIVKASSFESAKITGTLRTVLKDFLRLTREARPDEVRTKDTCAIALTVIQRKWREERDYRWCESQLKSLRQDLKVQHIRDKLAVRTYETHARICLEVSDFSEYNQCQTALRSLYDDDARNRTNEKEFVVYRILYLEIINDYAGFLRAIGHSRTRDDKFVKLCVGLYRALKTGNYVEVFTIYKQLPKLARNLIGQVKEKVRFQALTRICSSFCPHPYPISNVQASLGFESFKETKDYLRECHITLTKDGKQIDTKKSKGKVIQYVVKSKDDQHGITHGSLGAQSGDKAQEAETISHFLKKYS